MANIFDVAKYILETVGDTKMNRLQLLCYYSQAMSYALDGIPLFDEDFQAFLDCPICWKLLCIAPQLNHSVKAGEIIKGGGNLSKSQKDTVNKALEHYGCYETEWLSNLYMMDESSRTVFESETKSEHDYSIPFPLISKESMKAYYGGGEGKEEALVRDKEWYLNAAISELNE